jgi:hypothetical protein
MDLLAFIGCHIVVLAVIAGTAWATGRLACRALGIADVPPARTPPSAPARARAAARVPKFARDRAFATAREPALPPTAAAAPAQPGARPGGNPLRSGGRVRLSAPAQTGAIASIPAAARWAMAMALGLAMLGQAMLLVAFTGMLRVPVIVAGVLGVHLAAIAIGEWPRAVRVMWAGARSRKGRRRTMRLAMLVTIAATPVLLLALYPPLGFDETMYHLPFARAFAASGAAPFLAALRFPAFPQLAEMLNAAVLLLAGDVATHLVGVVALAACAALVFAWARAWSSDAGGWLAMAILVGSPLALYLATSGYVEPHLALFGLAALYAVERGCAERRAGWIVAAGVLAGSAAAVKYLGLFFVPAAAALIVGRTLVDAKTSMLPEWEVRGQDREPRAPIAPMPGSSRWMAHNQRVSMVLARHLALYGIVALIALAPTYGHIIAQTGNPVFPFYPEFFGTSPWEAERYLGPRGGERLVLVSTLLWDVTFRRELVGGLPFASPGLAFGVPIAILAAWRLRRLRWPLAIACGYVLMAPARSHYFLGVAPLFCVVIGAGTASLVARREHGRRRGPRGRLVLAVALLLTLGGEAYAVYRLHRLGPLPATAEARERFLAAEQPLYAAISFVNRTAGPVAIYAIDAEQMVYYATGPFLGDHNGPVNYDHVEARARALNSLAAALDEAGAAFLLLPARAPAQWRPLATADPRLTSIYEDGRATVYRVQTPATPPLEAR